MAQDLCHENALSAGQDLNVAFASNVATLAWFMSVKRLTIVIGE